jgi:hypothetical protein
MTSPDISAGRAPRCCVTSLQRLAEPFDVPRAAIIRQLLAPATPDPLPASWHLRVAERHGAQARPVR